MQCAVSPQRILFDIFMLVLRPLLVILVMMIASVFMKAFTAEITPLRQEKSIFHDARMVVTDVLHRRRLKVTSRHARYVVFGWHPGAVVRGRIDAQ